MGPAVLLMNVGPPPSLRSALHLGLHRLGGTTGRARRCRNSAELTLVSVAAGFRASAERRALAHSCLRHIETAFPLGREPRSMPDP